MVMVYYVDCRFYLLQAMYAYGLKGFLIPCHRRKNEYYLVEAHLMVANP